MRVTVNLLVSKLNGRSTSDFLAKYHLILRSDYKTSDRRYREGCCNIAVKTLRRLLAEGKQAYLMEVAEEETKGGTIKAKDLTPVLFEGRVSWASHLVACARDIAYDPIIGRPVPINDYCRVAFGEDIQIKVLVPFERIREFIAR